MRPPSPRSLLVEHPALPQPFDRAIAPPSPAVVASLDRSDRIRIAAQLVSVTALLADFELWPRRSALRRARIEVSDHGLRVRLPTLPVSISRIWSGLGGGDPAAEDTRTAVLEAIADLTGLEPEVFSVGGAEPGFFLDGVLGRLLGEIKQPLDDLTARSLWMWRWSLPEIPDVGDTSLLKVPDERVARRLGAAVWAAAVRSGDGAIFEVVQPGKSPRIVAESGAGPKVRVIAGTFDDQVMPSIIDPTGRPVWATIALGRFPDGWNPLPAPVYDPDRLSVHLAVAGVSPGRGLRLVDDQVGRFDAFSSADRRSLTRAAARLFSEPRLRTGGRFRELVEVAGLAPGGVPAAKALELAGSDDDQLQAACESRLVVRRGDLIMASVPAAMVVDPRHSELVDLYDQHDPRRLLHAALASGNPGELLEWAREQLDDLNASVVRQVLSRLAVGTLGPGVQVALVEACLCLRDIHGARRSLAGLGPEIARPWLNWQRLIDRPPEREVERPRPIDLHQAPRACAEIALVSLMRALWWDSESSEAPLNQIGRALEHLRGMAKRWVEIKLAALVEPERLDDPAWRKQASAGHRELEGLILFERSVQAIHQEENRLARRLLRRVMSAERAPGRLALMQVNLGVVEARLGRHQEAEAQTLGAFRLFQTAGFLHRGWEALHNLAVADIDRLRVDRASARLETIAEAQETLFVQAEQARLALALGDLELFRSRLRKLPAIGASSTAEIVQALSFLYGVEALFFESPTAAFPLLKSGGEEAVVWLELVQALLGVESGIRASSSEDDWGVQRAAVLVRSTRGEESIDSPEGLVGAPFGLRDAFAVALCRRLGQRCEREHRLRALRILDERGLKGWAANLRWESSEVEGLFGSLAEMLRNQGLPRLDDRAVEAILAPLGITGLVVRWTRNGRELLRVGSGEEYPTDRRGSLELAPLGGEPVSAPAWSLLSQLLELTSSSVSSADASRQGTEVRIDGVSPAAESLRDEIRKASGPKFTVLIHGETGTGKEVVAREIHRLSGRGGELISVNVAGIPVGLLDAELFGSLKGAFTGAERSRRGLVAAADGGTLFLDEVGDLDAALQVKLLRFLESGEVRAVGSDQTKVLDVRVVCATHRNLERRVREGRFREDLFYRIGLAKVQVPALRERLEDILILKSIFETEASQRHGLPVSAWSAAAETGLMNHRWPGNIRELKHTVEAAMARASGETIRPEHLQLVQKGLSPRGSWEGALSGFKQQLLREVLTRHRGNRSAAARELDISRQALLYQIKKLGLDDL